VEGPWQPCSRTSVAETEPTTHDRQRLFRHPEQSEGPAVSLVLKEVGAFSSHVTTHAPNGLQPLKKALPFLRFLRCSGRRPLALSLERWRTPSSQALGVRPTRLNRVLWQAKSLLSFNVFFGCKCLGLPDCESFGILYSQF
jgi:hypothetical protein